MHHVAITLVHNGQRPQKKKDCRITLVTDRVPGIVVLEVHGAGMKNVGLLLSSGYAPKHGQFQITNNGSFAYLNFDTRNLPNGPPTVRIAAFNSAAEKAGREITAMPSRQWIINN